MVVNERVRILVEAINKNVSTVATKLQTDFKKVTKQMKDFQKVMVLPVKQFAQLNNDGRKFSTVGGQMANKFRMLTGGLKGFRMEMLGVLFFGQALKQFFQGMIQPALDLFGVFDLIQITLGVFFLPIVEMLMPLLLQMMEFFLNVPEPIQKVVGAFTLLGVGIGALLATFGALNLGLGSLGLTFPKLIGFIFGFLSSIGGLFVVLAIGVIAIIVGISSAWKDNFLNMRQIVATMIGGLKQMFRGLFIFISGIFDVIIGLFTGNADKVFNGLKKLVMGFIGAIVGSAKFLGSLFNAVTVASLNLVKNIISAILGLFGVIFSKVVTLISKIGSFITKGFKGSTPKKVNDFVMRPGQAPIEINPNDTLVGFKGNAPNLGGGQGITVNTTNNVQVLDKRELERMFDTRDKRLVDELRRLVGSRF